MVFLADSQFGTLNTIPDDIPISEFILNEKYGRLAHRESKDPFTCGLSGKTYSSQEIANRVDEIARGLAHELGWDPNYGTEWDKCVAVFCVNAIESLPFFWAVNRLAGIVSPANAASNAGELKYQIIDSGAQALFTCAPMLPVALEAASLAGIPKDKIYLIDVAPQLLGTNKPTGFKTISQIAKTGKSLPPLAPLRWAPGEGARRTAYLCYSSGTSGLPKGVKISHRNVIANVLQIEAFENTHRKANVSASENSAQVDIALGLLPQSHIYSLVVICHAGAYRGDQTIVLPKFELKSYLAAIQNFKINALFLVPPIIINMLKNRQTCSQYDLSSVNSLFTGAAPLGEETAIEFQKVYPNIIVRQGYGLTETSTVVTSTHPNDILLGSSGCLIPGVEARIISPEGQEITSYDTPGELVVRSPSVVIGYLNNEKATKETFVNGWMHTGDEAVVRLGPNGTEHIFIVDRIKELIKVKGHQVAPAELEAHLLTHPAVADCAVISVPDEAAGEVPKAIVVKSLSAGSDEAAMESVIKYVEEHKARHKWLKGGVRFTDVVPKSPSGKILRRLLRDQEKEARRKAGVKL